MYGHRSISYESHDGKVYYYRRKYWAIDELARRYIAVCSPFDRHVRAVDIPVVDAVDVSHLGRDLPAFGVFVPLFGTTASFTRSLRWW